MKITLADLNPSLCGAWERAFSKIKEVTVKNYDIFLCGKFDAIVSPANSFGEMSGGIDGVYTKHFGHCVQKYLQAAIQNLPMRELLVGQSLIVQTDNKEIPYLISSPTMRVPLDVSDTANPYLAFKSSLCIAKQHKFENIICPGLGTLTGNVSPEDCARQMFQAYYHFNDKYPTYPRSINEAYRNHLDLVGLVNIKRKMK